MYHLPKSTGCGDPLPGDSCSRFHATSVLRVLEYIFCSNNKMTLDYDSHPAELVNGGVGMEALA
jgi:hypothetical protein